MGSNLISNWDGAGRGGRVFQLFWLTRLICVHVLFEQFQLFSLFPFLFGQLFVFIPQIEELFLQLYRHFQLFLKMQQFVSNCALPDPQIVVFSANLFVFDLKSTILSLQELKVILCDLDCF